MDYHYRSAWDVIKKFLIGWLVVFGGLVIISCIKYWDFITTAFANNIWIWVNAMLPVIIIIFLLFYMLRSFFK